MNILLLGTGMQGKAALHDLAASPAVSRVVAVDRDLANLSAYVLARGYGDKVICADVDARDRGAIERLMADGVDVVIDLLPVPFIGTVAPSVVAHGRFSRKQQGQFFPVARKIWPSVQAA